MKKVEKDSKPAEKFDLSAGAERERPPVLAHLRFVENVEKFKDLTLEQRFEHIYHTNFWGDEESRSGLGSAKWATAALRKGLHEVLKETNSKILLDIPCGDFNWFSEIADSVERYLGGDIVPGIVARNRKLFGAPNRTFLNLDLTRGPLPKSDFIFCRDCLVHLSSANVLKALASIRRSGASFLATTTFSGISRNTDIEDGDWRPLNFTRPPISFPEPFRLIVEGCTEEGDAYADKSIGVWRISDLPEFN
jgi:SAM-dependent methyltransferase